MTSIHHLYLCLKNFEESKVFYIQLFSILKLEHISTIEEYSLFTYGNDNFQVGIMPVSEKNLNDEFDKFRIGMSHIAFKVDSKDQIDNVIKLVKENNLELESDFQVKPHHLIDMPTIVFYCPSGIKIEIVL
jgi:catechol 2,3-dioxygenase-like lactoylglutathione lyase family enzyme